MKRCHLALVTCVVFGGTAGAQDAGQSGSVELIARPGRFPSLTEPACDYCISQHRKGLIADDDRVVAWLRGAHNGGAIPVRHFLSAPRVINDSYGLFFYDPDGGYVTAFEKDYGYEFHGWRRGVMVVRGADGTLWSALTGIAFDGPQKGKKLTRIPSMVTAWQHWLMLHPESVAYQMYDGKRYPMAELPSEWSAEARQSMGAVDPRLEPTASVIGVVSGAQSKAFVLDDEVARAVYVDTVAGQPVAVFWFGPTRTAVAFRSTLDGQPLTFHADKGSPETAPFKDRESGTRWTLAGRAVDGPLRGKELQWIDSVQCRWYAWSAEFPGTELHQPAR